MPSALAPLAKMMEDEEVFRFAGSKESQSLWRAIFSNAVFWKVKRAIRKGHMNRRELIGDLVDTNNRVINQKVMNAFILKDNGFEQDPIVFARLFQVAKKFKRSTPIIDKDLFLNNDDNLEQFKHFLGGYNFDVFLAVEVTKALLAKKSTMRRKERAFPYLESEEAAWEWLTELHEKGR